MASDSIAPDPETSAAMSLIVVTTALPASAARTDDVEELEATGPFVSDHFIGLDRLRRPVDADALDPLVVRLEHLEARFVVELDRLAGLGDVPEVIEHQPGDGAEALRLGQIEVQLAVEGVHG